MGNENERAPRYTIRRDGNSWIVHSNNDDPQKAVENSEPDDASNTVDDAEASSDTFALRHRPFLPPANGDADGL
ncbi:hypothetical protein B5P45_17680 [Phyllobacterium zundukense]|uniref:Uncharacterized protein n=1 Tax=Phyllobacterium zundukense TaxID=1867719 RepID=A0A2N9VW54_9HYPH|nr:hypothetical protein BLM14_07300 [Phyllobacterium zundukense]PIO43722.1 hypothetical protein B5P45_17680 [Phyllobacterium zundukense]